MSEDELYQYANGELAELTSEEKAERLACEEEWAAGANSRLAAAVRKRRNDLLRDSDWIIIRAMELGNNFSGWHEYRQQLRDIPAQEGFPSNVVWPSVNLLR